MTDRHRNLPASSSTASASATDPGDPPETWPIARRLAVRAYAPLERFLRIEAASGILLLAVTIVALVWANSPWRESYVALWHLPIGFTFGPLSFERDLHFWINDGVMTVFFFVVGLEIRREIHGGELRDARRAALPLVAALGGMVVPASIYAAMHAGRDSIQGWGIPMATDIAFAVGVLTLLGTRVPPALRILLLALAVIDDIGAILVIAVFYSSGFQLSGFAAIGAGVLAVVAMRAAGVRSPWAYVPPAAALWAGTYAAGIHPTLAGVALGMMTPVRAWFGREKFVEEAGATVAAVREQAHEDERGLLPHLEALKRARREAVSPVDHLQHSLHGWVAYGAMPLFAFANAGVALGGVSLAGQPLLVLSGVALGLVVGKPVGILLFSWCSVRLGVARLPDAVTWPQIGLVGVVAGIGFTMSLFLASLAFQPGSDLESAKLGILAGSAVAALLACALGVAVLPSAASRSEKPAAEGETAI